MDNIINDFEDALLSLDRVKVQSILAQHTDRDNFIPSLENIVVPAMENIGYKWEKGDVALSQIYMGGRICEEVVDELLPKTEAKRKDDPNIALVVFKDHHILGKRIVYTFLRASGYDVIDYGQQHDVDDLVQKLKEDNIEILLVSVLMLNSALKVKGLTELIKKENLSTKVIVGGAPFRFDKNLFKEVGADAFASNASNVIDVIETLKG